MLERYDEGASTDNNKGSLQGQTLEMHKQMEKQMSKGKCASTMPFNMW